ncbi:MAG: GNAT family N-acetyltransferase [Halodesulfurarchaeum sp.]
MDEDVRIEVAKTDQLEQIVLCWLDLIADQREFGTHMIVGENRSPGRDILGRYVARDNLLVARQTERDGDAGLGDSIVGFVMFQIERGLFEQDVTRGFVENLYVVPSERNRGVGTALLERAEAHLKRNGAEVVALSAMAENEGAREFYRKRGYTPHRITYEREV